MENEKGSLIYNIYITSLFQFSYVEAQVLPEGSDVAGLLLGLQGLSLLVDLLPPALALVEVGKIVPCSKI